MNTWIFPAVIACLLSGIAICTAYGYVYLSSLSHHIKLWTWAWVLYALRFVFTLGILKYGASPLLASLELLSTLTSAFLLLLGTERFVGKSLSRYWSAFAILTALWSVLSIYLDLSQKVGLVAGFFFMGVVQIRTGIVLFGFKDLRGGAWFAGLPMIIWGLHKFNYPFLRYVEWFAPWGFLLGSLCGIFAALGFLILGVESGFSRIRQEEKRYRRLIENSSDSIFLADKKGLILDVNEAACKTLDYPRETLIGMTIDQIDVNATIEQFTALWSQTDPEHPLIFETMHRRKDGGTINVEIKACCFDEDGKRFVLGFVRDITERKKAECAMKESEERYRYLFEQSLDAIAIQEGMPPVFTWVNPAFCDLFAYSSDEIYSMQPQEIWNLVYREDIDLVRQSLINRLEGRLDEVRYAFRIQRRDGGIRWVDVTGKRVMREGMPMNISIYRDITEKKASEEMLTRAKEQAEAATRSKSEFLANMSHEIRTPLNGIQAMLQLLERSSPTPEQKEYLDAALKSSRRLTGLLSDILDLSAIESGKVSIRPERFRPSELQTSISDIFHLAAREKGLRLEFSIDPGLPDELSGDEARLRQIIFNLVGNAIKFTDKGSVRVHIQALPQGTDSTMRVLFMVEDSGIGITDEQLRSIFEPFVQAEGTYTRRFQGAGLGLSIVRKLVRLMGGGISIDNTPGEGTTFYVSLPFQPCEPGIGQDAQPAKESSSLPPPGAALRMLIAEDDEVSLISAKRMLEKLGYSVIVARNGKEVIELLEKEYVDIVLMDVQMPVMDGLEATRMIRRSTAWGARKDVPIVAMTAYAMIGDRDGFLAAGMNDYIAKPVDMDSLADMVERYAGRKRPL